MDHRNRIKPIREALDTFKRLPQKNECYISHFLFNGEIKIHLKAAKGSVRGFSGKCYGRAVWIDIDISEKEEPSLQKRTEKAQLAAQKYVSRLRETYHIEPDDLAIHFTGSKGFCIGIPVELLNIPPSENFNQICKGIVKQLVDGEIEIDPSVYDKTRLWRIPGSLNEKANLYKIPLTRDELFNLSAQDIIVMAEEPREIERENGDLKVNPGLHQLYLKVKKEIEEETTKAEPSHEPVDLSAPPPKTKLCYWKPLQTGVPKGLRNKMMLRLSKFIQKDLGMNRDIARVVLLEADRKNQPPMQHEPRAQDRLTPKKLEGYLDAGLKYDWGCRDEILQGACDPRCYLYRKKDESFPLMTARQLEETNLREATPIIEAGILPAEAGMILAGPSESGKSLLMVEMGIRLALGMDFLGFNVPQARCVLLIQKENALIQVKYRIRRIREALGLHHAPENLHLTSVRERFNLTQSPDQERLKNHITNTNAEVTLLDPLSSFHSGDENDNMRMRMTLDVLTDISRELKTAFVVVHHYGKQKEYRGASSIKDWADTLIGYEEQYHIQRILRKVIFVKVRNGPKPRPILLERHPYDFSHRIIEEETLCPPEKVKEILDEMGGLAESKKALTKEILDEVKCSYRTARRSVEKAIEEKYLQEVEDEQDKRKRQVISK